MAQGHWLSRADLDLILDKVAENWKAVKSGQFRVKIAYPVGVVALVARSSSSLDFGQPDQHRSGRQNPNS